MLHWMHYADISQAEICFPSSCDSRTSPFCLGLKIRQKKTTWNIQQYFSLCDASLIVYSPLFESSHVIQDVELLPSFSKVDVLCVWQQIRITDVNKRQILQDQTTETKQQNIMSTVHHHYNNTNIHCQLVFIIALITALPISPIKLCLV